MDNQTRSSESRRLPEQSIESRSIQSTAPISNPQRATGQHLSRPQTTPAAPSRLLILVRVIALLLAISILALQAHSAHVWLTTRHDSKVNVKTGVRTPLWARLDMWPTWIMLGAAVIATSVHLIALGSRCCLHSSTGSSWRAVYTYSSSALVIAAWLGAIIYFKVWKKHGENQPRWNLQTWTCHRKSQHGKIPWAGLCMEQDYTFIASIIAVVFELLGLVLFVIFQRRPQAEAMYRKDESSWRNGWQSKAR